MPYEFCKHPETGEVAAATGFKLRAGWKPCDAKGNTGEETAPAAKAQRRKASKVKVDDYVSGQDVPPADDPSDAPSEPQPE